MAFWIANVLAYRHCPSEPVSLLARRSRQDLILILVRAHRNGDAALVQDCQRELDHRWRLGRQHARTAVTAR